MHLELVARLSSSMALEEPGQCHEQQCHESTSCSENIGSTPPSCTGSRTNPCHSTSCTHSASEAARVLAEEDPWADQGPSAVRAH
eukprot:2895911-Pyramimonas_sp.AAC.1